MFWRRFARINDKYSEKMNKEKNLKEKFKQALISTIKAIYEDYKLEKEANKN